MTQRSVYGLMRGYIYTNAAMMTCIHKVSTFPDMFIYVVPPARFDTQGDSRKMMTVQALL